MTAPLRRIVGQGPFRNVHAVEGFWGAQTVALILSCGHRKRYRATRVPRRRARCAICERKGIAREIVKSMAKAKGRKGRWVKGTMKTNLNATREWSEREAEIIVQVLPSGDAARGPLKDKVALALRNAVARGFDEGWKSRRKADR